MGYNGRHSGPGRGTGGPSLYREMDTFKVETTDLPVSAAVDAILRIVGAGRAPDA